MNDRIVRLTYEQEHPQRLDKYLVEQLPEFSRSRLQSLIKEGRVTVDGVIASKSGQSVDRVSQIIVEIPPPQPSELVAEEIALDIVFENDDLLVVNKPAGMVVHPSAGHQSGTLVHAALAHADDIEDQATAFCATRSKVSGDVDIRAQSRCCAIPGRNG